MRLAIALAVAFGAAGTGPVYADGHGAPHPWQFDLPEPVTEVAHEIAWFHDIVLVLCAAITIFVVGLVIWTAIAYRASVHPTPSRRTHHVALEIIWTLIPAVILIALVIPSLRLLYLEEVPPEADLTIKATGHQWYWSYEYTDEGFEFDAVMLDREEVAEAGLPDSLWKLATDNVVVVPVNYTVLVQVTASDVIHAWTITNFGSKVDAVPGRLNETWFRAEKEGTYFGQCSELCGRNHAYMPIMLQVVSESDYARWLEQAREEFASIPDTKTAAISGS